MTQMPLLSFDFRIPNTKEELCRHIGISEEFFEMTIDPEKHVSESVQTGPNSFHAVGIPKYGKLRIAKRNKKQKGEFREVWEPYGPIKNAYKSFNRRFDLFLSEILDQFPHTAAFGFVRGKNTLENAQVHSGAALIVNADIRNFFPSITKARLCDSFKGLNIRDHIAELLAEFATIENALPQGFPSSPMLANFMCLTLDADMQILAEKYDCRYTRYADDMTFSGAATVPSKAEVSDVLKAHDFDLSERKFRTSKRGQSHYVTGLSVSDPDKPRIPRKMKRRLRQELYYCRKYGILDHLYKTETPDEFIQMGINRLDGYVRYISHVEKEALPKIREKWAELLERDGESPSYASYQEQQFHPAFIFIDESELKWNGERFLALSLVATKQDDELAARTLLQQRKFIADPFSDGDVAQILKKGLHFVDATEDLKGAYVGELETFPLNAYTVYCKMSDTSDYVERYHFLLRKILPHRFMHYDRTSLHLVFEENSKIKLNPLKSCIEDIEATLKSSNNRCPSDIEVIISTKAECPQFGAPDFFLGVWGKYAKMDKKKPSKPLPRAELMFERLRDKQRVIVNADTGLVFSRKRPFRSFYELRDQGLM